MVLIVRTAVPTFDRVTRALTRRGRRLEQRTHLRLLRFTDHVRCPACGWSGLRFAPSAKPRRANRICPACQSSERYRALVLHLRRRGRVPPGTRLLEVAPIHTVERTARELGYDYVSLDLRSPTADVLADLTAIPFPDATFDLAVCFHVLEHITDDRGAVAELARVVGTGEAIVVVPRNDDLPTTFEVEGADPADHERLYGQSDDVRIYGCDLLARWRQTGVAVAEDLWVERFTPEVHVHAALAGDDDRFWLLTTSP